MPADNAPRLHIGRASQMNFVAGSNDDRAAIAGIVNRAQQLRQRIGHGPGLTAAERATNLSRSIASFALDAANEARVDRAQAIAALETAAALAIAAIVDLQAGR